MKAEYTHTGGETMVDRTALRAKLAPNPHFYRDQLIIWGITVTAAALILLCALLCIYGSVNHKGYAEEMAYDIADTDLCTLTYTGETRGGKPAGEGTMTIAWKNGTVSKYVGAFRSGKPSGKGVFYYSDGTAYSADDWTWKEDPLPDPSTPRPLDQMVDGGSGMHADGDIYGLYLADGIIAQQGEWYKGHLNGFGTVRYDAKGTVYERNDLSVKYIAAFGEGIYRWEERTDLSDEISTYQGYLKDGVPCAYAKLDYADGASFTGVMDDGFTPLFGSYIFPSYCTFWGTFDKYGHPCYGAYLTASELAALLGSLQEGSAETDEILKLSNRAWTYDDDPTDDGITGMLLDGTHEGYGTWSIQITTESQTVTFLYRGEWTNDFPGGHGQFSYTVETLPDASGNRKLLDSYGKSALWTFANPKETEDGTYAGMMRDGKYEGIGTLLHPDGTKESGIWKDGALVVPFA